MVMFLSFSLIEVQLVYNVTISKGLEFMKLWYKRIVEFGYVIYK